MKSRLVPACGQIAGDGWCQSRWCPVTTYSILLRRQAARIKGKQSWNFNKRVGGIAEPTASAQAGTARYDIGHDVGRPGDAGDNSRHRALVFDDRYLQEIELAESASCLNFQGATNERDAKIAGPSQVATFTTRRSPFKRPCFTPNLQRQDCPLRDRQQGCCTCGHGRLEPLCIRPATTATLWPNASRGLCLA